MKLYLIIKSTVYLIFALLGQGVAIDFSQAVRSLFAVSGNC